MDWIAQYYSERGKCRRWCNYIALGLVVSKNVDPFTIVGGNPANPVKKTAKVKT